MTSITEHDISVNPQNSENEVILSVNGVSKKFCRDLKRSLVYGVQDIFSELVGLREKSDNLRPKEFWALKDVSFQLRRGESLGLVGKNGSGKSTLLRIVSGLIKPDTGLVEVNGRLAPLIALGAGFNPILTGRENIYANMAILGLAKKEIDERFDAVVEFAEIGDAIDSPVQSYSSGMAARLGFASAIYTEPDILLIDEVLAVGDMKFRIKCYRRLAELRKKGTSFILVSHSPQSILSICDSAVYLSRGTLIASGETLSVMNQYESDLFLNTSTTHQGTMTFPEKNAQNSSGVDITYLCFKNEQGEVLDFPLTGESVNLCIGCKAHKKVDSLNATVIVSNTGSENERVLFLESDKKSSDLTVSPGNFELRLHMPCFGLKPGVYTAKLNVAEGILNVFDAVETFVFSVKSESNMNQCLYYQQREWKVVKDSISPSSLAKNSQ
ncbi:ABC transporter ATP-binding protein [Scytonema hofmannii PCC 7110]|uniref:ABC transporter ATP-binding protein n=1 Tax=Scytonema hofmannii PCC 7110 TaxID=128403 RepID=A0A139XA53_9CYAN|nr:polysaccharide ABC transporter ATP-binding protein [Scytonema hofmannii]KYC41577.1 ABC transporter ATP-binding protein [Scytonema hofmannii PCC 7110]